MEAPYRFLKNLQKMGNSVGIILPKEWFQFKQNDKIKQVICEVYSDKIVLLPERKKGK